MVRTRRGTKRISPNSAENESTDIAEKKPKLIPETCSKYFEKNVQSTNPDVKIEAGETATKENAVAITDDSNDSMTNEVLKQKSKKVLKIKDESDSDESSSDEFMKVPFSLDELGGFETLKKESNLPSKVNNTMLSSAMTRLSDDSGDEKETNEQNEYYDFSQIMESQEIISKTKKEQEEKANIKKTLPNNTKSKRQSGRVLKKSKAKPNHDIKSIGEELGITELLTMAEGSSMNSQEYSDSSDEEDSKEEVKTEKAYSVPEEGVQVTIELPNLKQKRKSKGFDLESAMKRRINLIKRENQVYIHKVHLLCWIAHGIFLNRAINNDDLMGLALSLIPSKHCYPPKHADLNYLDKLVEWFVKKVTVNKNNTMLNSSKISLMGLLESQINSRVVSSHRDLVLIFVCMVRSLGISARLVISLRPAPLRPPASDLCQINNKGSESKPNSESKQRKSVTSSKTKKETASKSVNVKEKQDLNHSSKKVSCARKSKNEKQPILNTSRTVTARKGLFKNETKSQNPAIQSPYFSSSDEVPLKDLIKNDLQSRKTKHLENEKTNESSSNSKAKSATTRKDVPKAKNVLEKVSPYFSSDRRTKRSVNVSYQDPGSSSSEDEVKIPKSTTKQKINKEPDKIVNGVKTKPQKKSVNTKRKSGETSDCDFEPPKASTSKKKSLDRRVLSSDEETIGSPKKIGNDFWAEVFLEAEEKWISVDLRRGKVHCIQQLYSGATQPVRYVVAWDNAGAMKDVTRRYAPQWMTVTRRQRVDESWWRETVVPYAPRPSHREREEDEDLDRQLHDKPLPTTVTEYKNHPLYALRRHLLKFEAIYPPDAPPLGFVRGEPVYSRGCVAELHTRETWIKEAKVVRRNEEPYKIVKARPKWDKVSQTVITDLPLPLFGHWQVEDYIPPPAVDGKVPRNEYGNVELYKPCMLPPGTVHLQVPQLARVARKLGIDCAPAVVGWEYSGGGSHPVLDGFIVCEESKDVLMDAWDKEMDESAKRAKEKVAARVYGNWKRLIRGLMIRERLKARYDFGVPVPEKKKKQQPKPSTSKS